MTAAPFTAVLHKEDEIMNVACVAGTFSSAGSPCPYA